MGAFAAALAALALAAEPSVVAPGLRWFVGPALVELRDEGVRCAVPTGVALAAGAAARSILDVVTWGTDGSELAVLSPVAPSRRWFVVLSRRTTPAPADAGRAEGDRRAGAPVWLERPTLDERTGRTSWALAGRGAGGPSVNRHVLLPAARGGAIEVTLVAPVEELSEAGAQLERIVDGLSVAAKPASRPR